MVAKKPNGGDENERRHREREDDLEAMVEDIGRRLTEIMKALAKRVENGNGEAEAPPRKSPTRRRSPRSEQPPQ